MGIGGGRGETEERVEGVGEGEAKRGGRGWRKGGEESTNKG